MQRPALTALGLTGALLLGIAVPRMQTVAESATGTRSITVTAQGTVQVTPDVAFVTVGVLKTDIDAAKAQDQANSVAAKALADIKALGIPDRDIQTTDVSLNPQYDDRNVLTGFQAADSFAITVEHTAQAGAVIDAAVAAGANQNISVSFGLKDSSSSQSAALRAAVAVAQHKAAAVAAQLGISLVGAKIQVQETSSQPPTPLITAAQRSVAGPNSSTPTPIQAGTLAVQDSVTVTYTL